MIVMKTFKFFLLLCLASLVLGANKEEWRKRSIYQLLTDRFARNDGLQTACSNLGIIILIKETIVEVVTEESSII